MESLVPLSRLIHTKNQIEREIASIVGRPALLGHVGEYVASEVFGIKLEDSASQKGIDGRFIGGQLAGRTINVKWYAKRKNILDMVLDDPPDFYLVMTGPGTPPASSRGTTRPWLISTVYLFDSQHLIRELRSRGVKIGVAASVAGHYWEEAEIYPTLGNERLFLSTDQKAQLALFG